MTEPVDSFSLLAMKCARAHREAALALDETAAEFSARIAKTKAVLADLEAARASAASQSSRLLGQARALALEALSLGVPGGSDDGSRVAVKFHVGSLAATRRNGAKEHEKWSRGEAFSLRRQPDNPVDPNAIMIMKDGKHVGFVGKDDAAALKKMEIEEGWSLCGPAFLQARKGGTWNEGTIHIRLENPVLGWGGYNPGRGLDENVAAMEAQALGASTMQPSSKRKGVRAL